MLYHLQDFHIDKHEHYMHIYTEDNRRHKGRLLTNWGRVTHMCVSKPTIIGSDNGLSPDRRQAII